MEHFKGSCIRSQDNFQTAIYVFDDSVILTSANLTKAAFESNIEAGVLLDTSQVDEVKSFFSTRLWENAKPLTDVKKYKKLWNAVKKNDHVRVLNKVHTKIREWTDDYVNKWYFAIPEQLTTKTERKIKKESNWPANLSVAGDIGPVPFKQLKLGDLAFLINLRKRIGKIEVEFARVFDKSRVETDEGDLHFAYETKKIYQIERNQFRQMLENANITPKSYEILLNENQVQLITKTLSTRKSKK
jgi:hypothetical protein